MPIRPDYEATAAAAIDYLTARGDVDADRIGVNGASLGGYYAARVAAHEPRVKATVANCGPYDWAECFDDCRSSPARPSGTTRRVPPWRKPRRRRPGSR
jgi:pimeloyl-ACP methyl ester carboxylesterase